MSQTARDKAKEAFRWAVVIKLANGNDFNLHGLAAVLKRAWSFTNGINFLSTSNNVALVKFDSEDKLLKIMDGGPWTFDGVTVMIRRWYLESNLETIEFDTLRIWVQLHNIPVDMLMEEATVEIAAVAGKVRKRVSQEMEVMKMRFVRSQIEINIHHALKPGCYVDGWDGRPRWVQFKYERLPLYCKNCGVLDHTEAACRNDNPSKRFGVWLRAESDVKWEPEGDEVTTGNIVENDQERFAEPGGHVIDGVGCDTEKGGHMTEKMSGKDGRKQIGRGSAEQRPSRAAIEQSAILQVFWDASNNSKLVAKGKESFEMPMPKGPDKSETQGESRK